MSASKLFSLGLYFGRRTLCDGRARTTQTKQCNTLIGQRIDNFPKPTLAVWILCPLDYSGFWDMNFARYVAERNIERTTNSESIGYTLPVRG